MPTDEPLDDMVLHNTRIRRRHRRAMELLVTAMGGMSYQAMTDDAIGAWLAANHPDVLAVVGDPVRETELAQKLIAAQISAQDVASRPSGR